MIGGIDLFIVIAFMVGIFAVGIYFKKFIRTSEDFFLAGRKLAWWVIGMSIIGTNIGSYDYVGGAGAACNYANAVRSPVEAGLPHV